MENIGREAFSYRLDNYVNGSLYLRQVNAIRTARGYLLKMSNRI